MSIPEEIKQKFKSINTIDNIAVLEVTDRLTNKPRYAIVAVFDEDQFFDIYPIGEVFLTADADRFFESVKEFEL